MALAAVVAACAAAAALTGCAAAPDPRKPAPDDAIVRIRCDVADAEVWVDGRYVAPLAGLRGGVALTPGRHRLELRHERYHTFYAELDLPRRDRRTLTVELAQVLE